MSWKSVVEGVTVGWKAILVIAALITFLVAAQRQFSAIGQVPSHVDSLRVLLQQHIDSSAKYGRLQTRYEHRILCVLAATSTTQKEHCVLDDIGEP